MYIFGHTGLTFAFYKLLKKDNQLLTSKNILTLAIVASLPDLLDSGIHLTIPKYPTHGIFHSIFFYAVSFPIAFFVFKRMLIYLAIMIANVMFDIVNVDLSAFLYPVYGWAEKSNGHAIPSPIQTFMDQWPKTIGYKLPEGHYLVFEIIGVICIIWVLRQLIFKSPSTNRT